MKIVSEMLTCSSCGKVDDWMWTVRTTKRFSAVSNSYVQLCGSSIRGKYCYDCAKKEKARREAEIAGGNLPSRR